ncbi:ABC transporter amino acid-binding protein [Candidatus Burkholderia verschuerenii]|uniref:ABC transporter amino acid-binding protein n=1 Tax=Candidatus Burkholderia verschuerenii TaxID=242163 RepID=A0A0L0MGM6_9BURK|nr:ABC transporter substrate-binding protein [Candidatus Burkholderia verschuerenii]KND61847.1 ABC transporter amino acid-binding protein [Candidatus Burkholderia verschuerenii]
MKKLNTFFAGIAMVAGVVLGGAAHAETLKVGSTPTGVPFTFLDTKSDKITGLMVDIMNEVGKEAGYDVTTVPLAWSALIPSLTTGKIDAVSAAMFVTPERQKVVDFTDTVYQYGEGLIVPKSDGKNYVSFADLKGKVVGAQIGTPFLKALQDSGLFAEVKVYETLQDLLRDINTGRLDAGVADYPILAYQVSHGGFTNTRLLTSYKAVMPGQVGIAVQKGHPDRVAKLNAAIAKVKADGRIDAIVKKWGL